MYGQAKLLLGLVCARIILNRSGPIIRIVALPVGGLQRKLHFIHYCTAKNGRKRGVRGISSLSNEYEARLWSQGELDRTGSSVPQEKLQYSVKVRRIQTIGIGTHESGLDSQ
jgi:hypothetical protein